MLLVKFLMVIKKLIYGVILIIIRPLFWVFKFLLTKPLIKLYHLIFKFKKSSLAESPWYVLVKQKALHVLVFCLTLIIVISNLVSNNTRSNFTAQANKTIVSHLVRNEFSYVTDDSVMIEEFSNLKRILIAGKETYSNLTDALINKPWISDTSENNSELAYNRGALINDRPLGFSEDNTLNTSPSGEKINRAEIIYYTVNNGDTISSIANKFQISINTILWSNDLTSFSLIRPGDKLTILPVSGTVYTVKSGDTVGRIALKFGVEENTIFKVNNISSANGLIIGKTLIIPGGKPVSTAVATTNSTATKSNSGAVAVIEKLVNPKQAPASNTTLLWPTEGHRITQYYSWRHTAIDIANKVGTPLYAANAGTVEFAGWSNGYGNNVVINHGGGMKTRYAHASKLFVSVGDKVARGEQIAAMGSTGNSTGPHIHFEVMVNGVKMNPLSYTK